MKKFLIFILKFFIVILLDLVIIHHYILNDYFFDNEGKVLEMIGLLIDCIICYSVHKGTEVILAKLENRK